MKLLRALVVDDDPTVRTTVAIALCEENFICDEVENVADAIVYLKKELYDLVVTDLQMPGRNGHSFAVELLARRVRPAIAVLTAVLEPRITKDLLCRGVDIVEFKPIEMRTFAAKMLGVTERHRSSAQLELNAGPKI